MKRMLFALLLLVAGTTLGVAQEEVGTGDLTIVVKNLENDEGQAVVSIFREQDKFFSHSGPEFFRTETSKIVNGEAIVVFKGLKYSMYSAAAVQDLNFNGKMDHYWFGGHKEPFGLSNGFVFSLFSGFPKFKDIAFGFTEEKIEQVIKIQ